MKTGIIRGFVFLLTLIALIPVLNAAVWASTATDSEAAPSPSVDGKGWFVFNRLRNDFAFAAKEGKLNETDGWRYAPNGYFSLAVIGASNPGC